MPKIVQKTPDGKEEFPASRRSAGQLREQIIETTRNLADWAAEQAKNGGKSSTLLEFEKQLLLRLFGLGRLFVALFLEVADRRVCTGFRFRGQAGKPRLILTFFGRVKYWRHYARRADGGSHYPTDVALGLTADQESWHILSLAVRLVTRMPYAQARNMLGWFTAATLSTEVMGRAVLGLGRYTQKWFEQSVKYENDGTVLVIEFDSKGGPTATDEELKRRRRPHRKLHAQSTRHRHRIRRNKYGSKPRRKKGDKSKHARMATLLVMYTLVQDGNDLLGPVNCWYYASFATKAHAVAVARRKAIERGFGPDSGKIVQALTDGDSDLARYIAQAIPWAEHTIDVIHVIEYLWRAGEVVYDEGSPELKDWVETQKKYLFEGDIAAVLGALRKLRDQFPQPAEPETSRRGPRPKLRAGAAVADPAAGATSAAMAYTKKRKKGPWERLNSIITYIEKRQKKMNYGDLRRRDLEIGTGAVEGAVKNIIGQRFDHGGMRWIRERAEALLQLRCIEFNGDWDRFIQWVHDELQAEAREKAENLHLLQDTPEPLPTLTLPEWPTGTTGESSASEEAA